jgi:GntR family transcriptional regulator
MVSFGQELRSQGHSVIAQTLALAEVTGDETVARKLLVPEGSRLIYLQRLFLVDDVPMALFDHYLSPILGIDSFRKLRDFPSLHDLLAENGYGLHGATEAISARLLTPPEAKILNAPAPCVAMVIDRVAWASDQRPILTTQFLVRADRMEYHVQVTSLS